MQSDAATYGRLQVQRQLASGRASTSTISTQQFYSIFRLQWAGDPARSFPFGATHVDELGYL